MVCFNNFNMSFLLTPCYIFSRFFNASFSTVKSQSAQYRNFNSSCFQHGLKIAQSLKSHPIAIPVSVKCFTLGDFNILIEHCAITLRWGYCSHTRRSEQLVEVPATLVCILLVCRRLDQRPDKGKHKKALKEYFKSFCNNNHYRLKIVFLGSQ